MKYLMLFLFSILFYSCQTNPDKQFSIENENLKQQWKIETDKFIKENHLKKNDHQMLKSLDSITYDYTITKNKQLAIKYVNSKSGLKRLNFLKKNFKKNEINQLIKKVPIEIQIDTNYIALKKYSEN